MITGVGTREPIGHIGIDNDELLTTALREFDTIFPELIEKVHDPGHGLRMRARSLLGGDDPLDRATIDHETSRHFSA